MRISAKDSFFILGVGALLGLIAVGLDVWPDDGAGHAAPVPMTTQVVPPEDAAAVERIVEAPLPESTEPQTPFVPAAETIRLIADAARIEIDGQVQRISISSIGLDSDVIAIGLEQRDGELQFETPNFVVGQYRGVNPGQGGNVVLAGHVGTVDNSGGAIFGRLHQVSIGDRIEVDAGGEAHAYEVTEVRFVQPGAVELMRSDGDEKLTLITCHECNVDCNRLVVIARPLAADPAA